MFEILLHKSAIKYYQNLDDKTAHRINAAIEKIRLNPYEGAGIKNLPDACGTNFVIASVFAGSFIGWMRNGRSSFLRQSVQDGISINEMENKFVPFFRYRGKG
jgi:hypothetical protein